jgi:low temperature requirement protein LtrA
MAGTREKRASWLELFYDLIYVAAFIQLGNGLATHVSVEGFLGFTGLFTAMWLAWTGFTFYANRFDIDDFAHRLSVFVQMIAVGAMAISAPYVLDAGADDVFSHRPFALAYAAAQGVITGMYARARKQVDTGRDYSWFWGVMFGASATVFLASAFVPKPLAFVMWAPGVLLLMAAPFSRHSRALAEQYPLDMEHLAERYGLLTLIVLGESFVKVISELAGAGELTTIAQASFVLVVTVCLWWVYFDDVAGSELKKDKTFAFVFWLFGHLPMHAGLVAVGVALKKAADFELAAPAAAPYRWLLCGSLALAVASVGVIDSFTSRRQAELSDKARVNVRLASAAVLVLLAPAGAGMGAGTFLALVCVVCVAQVLFDMMMAPLEAIREEEHAAAVHWGRSAEPVVTRRRRSGALRETVRKGTPSDMRRDFYFFFIEGTWTRMLGVFAFLYVVGNVAFAGLFMLQPDCLADGAATRFGSAFAFSVQTMATIGYGVLHPVTAYGDFIVTVEAGVSLLAVALATGLMFAKASRPRSSVLFSSTAVVTMRHGQPCVMFRCGNARGNEIVEASITVSILVDDVSPEGIHIRRVIDIPLVRSRSPIFTMTWTVMHELTPGGPLAEVDWSRPGEAFLGMVVTLLGHDATYGQTIHARHLYSSEDFRVGYRFVDVVSDLPDGRMLVDYDKFHDVVADGSGEVLHASLRATSPERSPPSPA